VTVSLILVTSFVRLRMLLFSVDAILPITAYLMKPVNEQESLATCKW
jgi:hypothetical protein